MTSQAFHGNSEISEDSGLNPPVRSLWRRVSEKVCGAVANTGAHLRAFFKKTATLVCLGIVSVALVASNATAAFAGTKYNVEYVPYPLDKVNNNGKALITKGSGKFSLYDIATGNTSDYDMSNILPANVYDVVISGFDDINRVSGYLDFDNSGCKAFVYNTNTNKLTIVRNPAKQPLKYKFIYIYDTVNAPNLWAGCYSVYTTKWIKRQRWWSEIWYGFIHNGRQLTTLNNPFVRPLSDLNNVDAYVNGGTVLTAINRKGMVAGLFQDLYYYDKSSTLIGDNKYHAFLRDANDKWILIDYDNNTATHPIGLTDNGKVLTWVRNYTGHPINDKGKIYNSKTGKWQSYPMPTDCWSKDINNKGVIVGSCWFSGSELTGSGYIATPVKPAAAVRAVKTDELVEYTNR